MRVNVNEEQLKRSYTWYCLTCADYSMYAQTTNSTAVKHIQRNPTHEVIGIGSMISKFTADDIPNVEDVQLPPMPEDTLEEKP